MPRKVKALYGLVPDSMHESGLTDWYNRLLEKTVDEINIFDVGKMNRQNILKDLAATRAIDLFLVNPCDGELDLGDIVGTVLQYSVDIATPAQVRAMQDVVEQCKKMPDDDDLPLEPEGIPIWRSNLAILEERLRERTNKVEYGGELPQRDRNGTDREIARGEEENGYKIPL